MLTFKQYLTEAKINANADSDTGHRHFANYIEPFLPGNSQHAKLTHQLHDGTAVTLTGSHVNREGKTAKRMVSVQSADGSQQVVLASKIQKPSHLIKNVGAAGFDREVKLAKQLVKHGMMQSVQTAGSSHGNDFYIQPKSGKKVLGSEAKSLKIGGESKIGFGAKFGESAIRWHPEKGWHFSEKTEQTRPSYTAQIKSMKIAGKPFFQHLNEQWADGQIGKTIRIPVGMEVAHSYLKDHHVGVLHVHSHGTYSVGTNALSPHLPRFEGGQGYVEIRSPGKGRSPRVTSYLKGNTVPKSSVDLMVDDHASKLAAALNSTKKRK